MCGWPNCRQLAESHVHGNATCKLPEDEDECREFLFALATPEEKHDDYVRRRCHEGEDLRYRTFHHHRVDRTLTESGLIAVKTGETNFRDDKRRGRLISPQPKRPRTGTLGVEASPSKKASPQVAATVYYKDKERREKGEAPVYDAAQRAGTAMPTPSPKEQARRAAGYHKPEQKDGIDPRELPAGTFLCTFEQVNELVQMVDAHNRRCSGTLSFRPNSCTFIGVTAHLRPECRTCGRKSWYSSPLCEVATPDEATEGATSIAPTPKKSFFLNELVSQAIGTTPVGIEAACYFLEGLHLRVPNKANLYTQINGPVADSIASTWHDEQAELLAEIKAHSTHPHLLPSLDGSHSGGSDAEVSRVNAIDMQSEKVLWSMASDVGSAQGREHRLGQQFMRWAEEQGLDLPAVCIDESSLKSVIEKTVRTPALSGLTDEQCMEAIIDLWHDKKNLKKNMADFSGATKPALKAMGAALAMAAEQRGTAMTDAAFGAAIDAISTAVRANLAAEHAEFEEHANKVLSGTTAVSDSQIKMAQVSVDGQRHCLELLHGIGHGTAGFRQPTHLLAGADVEQVRVKVDQLRQASASSAHRDRSVPSLTAWRIDSALKDELVAVVQGLHSDATIRAVAQSASRPDLEAQVLQCLPTAGGKQHAAVPISAVIADVTEELIATKMAGWNLPAVGGGQSEYDWTAWGQRQTPARDMSSHVANGGEARVLAQLTKYEGDKGARSTKKHPPFASMATLHPHKLSAAQLGLALTWLCDSAAAEKLDVGRCQARLVKLLPANPLLTFNLALDTACKYSH